MTFNPATQQILDSLRNHVNGICDCEFHCNKTNKLRASEFLFNYVKNGKFGLGAFREGLKILGTEFEL